MAKTLIPNGTMTREEYLLNLGKALYSQPSVKPLGISSSSKELKGGEHVEKSKFIREEGQSSR